jgi:probable rRNA maturation factor
MSHFEIEVQAEIPVSVAQQERVSQAATAALEDQKQVAGAACTILLTGDEQIRTLNREYLGQDRATDVLSFPAGEVMPGAGTYLGDVAISVAAAKRQADAGRHSLTAELQLLTVHAVLHLLGYDHATSADKKAMWLAQARILERLEAEITGPQET